MNLLEIQRLLIFFYKSNYININNIAILQKGGFLIICHSYGGRLSDYQLYGANYKNILENDNSPVFLPLSPTWETRSRRRGGT
jgi:hypothetical protein